MEVGSIAHFSGIYSGPDEIRVISPGAVRDLGKPVHAGVSIRIAVTKTLNNFTFLADYATEPVVATYNDLVIVGHEFVPHFTMNFNIRHVYVVPCGGGACDCPAKADESDSVGNVVSVEERSRLPFGAV
ncbi:hypothetical protein MRX96_006343 [Rhipicephalus microplus]